MKITTLLLAIATFAIVASCGKATPESETKRWEASKQTIEKLGAKYPGFKPALQQVLTEASTQWEAALAVSDAEKQIEAMRAANSAAAPSFITKLDGMSASLEALKDMVTEAAQEGTTDEGDKAAMATARNEANLTLNNVEGMLNSRSAATPGEAEALASEAATQIESATNRMKKVMDTVKAKKGQSQAASDTAAANNAAATDAQKSIKCGFCGTMNAHDALKCSSCAAPIEKK